MISNTLRLVMAQLNFLVGDIAGNATKIIQAINIARETHQAHLVIFPELALTGYPPEDLLYRDELYTQIESALLGIQAAASGIDVILGYPVKTPEGYCNQAAHIRHGEIVGQYCKQRLPNYQVFDEARYFTPGSTPYVFEIGGVAVGISICEDLWFPEPIAQAKAAGAQLIISLNASPFAKDKSAQRLQILKQRAQENHLPMVYVNCIGGQDELVFDGGSLVMSETGEILAQADFFAEGLFPVDIPTKEADPQGITTPFIGSEEARVYQALVLGVRDYIEKNHFPRAVLGLSGGIDSALTLAIAVDAIGADRVEAVMMPSRYTSSMSLVDAKKQAQMLNVLYREIPIESIFTAFMSALAPEFAGLPADVTEENLQARCRGALLMAISNKTHAIVLATGNKSEMAVGYSTLYGDLVGGFCVLKDVLKTWVYRLAAYRNRVSRVIPENVIERPPSAELAANQLDQDTLPPYSILDEIIMRYIEQDQSASEIIQAGFDSGVVLKVIRMIDRNEYKRRQVAPGVRITERAFGKDRRYPITSGFVSAWV